MKKYLKVFALLLVVSVFLTACFSKDKEPDVQPDVQPELTTSQIVEKIGSAINLDSTNLTLKADVEYSASTQPKNGATQSQSDSIKDIVLKLDGENMELSLPGLEHSVLLDNATYTKYAENDHYTLDYNFSDVKSDNDQTAISKNLVEVALKDGFQSLVNSSRVSVSSNKLGNGDYQLKITADIKQELLALKSAILDNKDEPLINFLDDVLKVYKPDLSVNGLVNELKQNINENSTLGDLFDFIEERLDISLHTIFTALIGLDESGDVSLQSNLFEGLGVANKQEFDEQLDLLVDELSSDDYTLALLLEDTIGEGLFEFVESIEINDFVIEIYVVTNSTVSEIKNIKLNLDVDVMLEETNYALSANFSLSILNIGTTKVVAPQLTQEDIEYITIEAYLEAGDLIKNQKYVLENIENYGLSFEGLGGYGMESYVSYDAGKKTLTISEEGVQHLFDYGNLYLSNTNITLNISYDIWA